MSQMIQRHFGNSAYQVSGVGLGTWQIGGQWGPEFSDETALDVLRTAVDSGVTFIDTADIYGLGRSETLIGKFLKETSEKLFIATKLGKGPNPGGARNFAPEVIRQHTEDSLRRLDVDCIDLMQLHCVPKSELEKGVMFEVLNDLRDEGKIRFYGASVQSDEEALVCLRDPNLASLQIIFNIFRQKPISEVFDKARDQGVAIIARLPLASGLLSGKMTADRKFPPNDHRNSNREGKEFNIGETFAGLPFEKGLELVEQIRPLVPAEMTMSQMALRWCLDFNAVTAVIPGAKNAEQVRENSAAGTMLSLPAPIHDRLQALYHTEIAQHIRGAY